MIHYLCICLLVYLKYLTIDCHRNVSHKFRLMSVKRPKTVECFHWNVTHRRTLFQYLSSKPNECSKCPYKCINVVYSALASNHPSSVLDIVAVKIIGYFFRIFFNLTTKLFLSCLYTGVWQYNWITHIFWYFASN